MSLLIWLWFLLKEIYIYETVIVNGSSKLRVSHANMGSVGSWVTCLCGCCGYKIHVDCVVYMGYVDLKIFLVAIGQLFTDQVFSLGLNFLRTSIFFARVKNFSMSQFFWQW